MHKFPALCVGALVVSAAFGASSALAQSALQPPVQPAAQAGAQTGAQSVDLLVEQLKAMRQQLDAQRARIDELERGVRSARQAGQPAEPVIDLAPGALAAGLPATASELDMLRGTGGDQTAAQQNAQAQLAQPPQQQPQQQQMLQQQQQQQQQQAQQAQQRQQQQQQRNAQQNAPLNPQNVPTNQQATTQQPTAQRPAVPQPAAPAAPVGGPASAPAAGVNTAAVGRAPAAQARSAEVAPIFEQPGVLTPRGKYVFEPAVQYGYSSSSRVALVGYTVIPALLIGLIDVREVKRNTTTASVTLRRGLTNRFEVEAKLPYVYRSDATVSREVFTGTSVERAFQTSGKDLGDIELAARYQLNDGGVDKPFFIGGLRFKSRTGKDPFEVVTDCTTRCIGENVTGSGLPLELPTGSGFYSLQPSLTWLFPSDPAVFFGSFSYLHNFKRDNIERTVLNGVKEPLGEVAPGGVFGFNFGMGLALNDKASFSLGYDHNSVGRTKQNGRAVPGSVRMQLGTLLVGYSYRLSDKKTLSVAVGAGVTRDTPDVTLMVRVPMSF